ncbi:hypothetical protein ACFVX6_19115 [Streptomyces sp. NPDC058289]|uniref:hypothetical protein n=1 Tax=Streptomyces sp. NPDC058289 TaxID=3346425 RepID=UPI0036ED83F3
MAGPGALVGDPSAEREAGFAFLVGVVGGDVQVLVAAVEAAGGAQSAGSTGSHPAARNTPDEWVSTLATLDGRLRLRHHKPDSLLDHQKELYQITDGLMEHLTPLIGMAAQLAILDGTEALTLEVLNDAARYLDLPHADQT